MPPNAAPIPTPPTPWSVGDVVSRYTLLAKIATGGMAEIWLARQAGPRGFEKVVVIKRIIDTYSHDPEFVEMFLDEARIAAQLNHPNIVQIYDLGEHAGAWYIAMEYLGGEHLSAIVRAGLKANKQLPLPLCVKMISLAAEGLGHAHAKTGANGQKLNIVHRDVSPQNVVLTYDGQLKVVDFGIAKAATRVSHTTSGLVKGKIGYMAPEQARGLPIDSRADLYSLGVVLYEMCTSSRLFNTNDQLLLMQQVVSPEPVQPAHERNPAVPASLSKIISKSLEKAADERYQDARAFQAALDQWLSDQGPPPGAAQFSDLMRELFAERIQSREKLLESASTGELTPSGAERALKVDTERSMPGLTDPKLRAARKTNRILYAVLAAVLVGAVVTAGLYAVFKPAAVVAPAPKAPARLHVETDPAAAAIELDHKAVGSSPLDLLDVPPGHHTIVATAAGHLPAVKELDLAEGEKTTVVLALKAVAEPAVVAAPTAAPADAGVPANKAVARTGKLTLSTTPWTKVVLNGRVLGDTPLVEVPLPAGKHVLKLTNDEKNISRSIEVEIKPGQTTAKKLSL
ncbi:MAG: serine/threonine-protein kinase [Myxococcaceae bacterium]